MMLLCHSLDRSFSISLCHPLIYLLSFLNLGALWKGSRSNQRVGYLDWGHLCSLYVGSGLTRCFLRQSVIQRCPSGSAQTLLTTTHTIQSSMSGHGLLDRVYRLKTSSLSWKTYRLQAACPLLVWERSEYTLFLTNTASLLRLPTPAASINPPHKKKQ